MINILISSNPATILHANFKDITGINKAPQSAKIKKKAGERAPALELTENADILKSVALLKKGRPGLVIGFAAETKDVLAYAQKKRGAKGADWIIANNVSPETGIMGGDHNTVHLITSAGVESWPEMTKEKVADQLLAKAASFLTRNKAAAE